MFYDLFTSALPHYYLGSQTMIILFGFLTISFIASTFVVAACAISGRANSNEALEEMYDFEPEVSWDATSHTTA